MADRYVNKNTRELLNAGSDILRSVTKAVDKNDFSSLASDISNVVSSVKIERTPYAYQRSVRRPQSAHRRTPYDVKVTYENNKEDDKPNYFLQKQVSKTTGVPTMSLTGVGGCIFASFGILGIIHTSIILFSFSALGLLACGALFVKGYLSNAIVRKYYDYGSRLKDSEYFSISELASLVVKTDKEVLKDIKLMMKKGFLPRARLDRTETTCMITDKSYELYQGALKDQEERILRQNAEKTIDESKLSEEDKALPENVRRIISDGNDYIDFIKFANDRIPDTEEMSNKLYKLEDIMNRIFDRVRKVPENAGELHRLMNYYLPTTKKLLNAYIELNDQPEVGDNITKTKEEIDSAMDMINEAFENLLDSLYQDTAWDISSDISVMKTMMAQDGLTDDNNIKNS